MKFKSTRGALAAACLAAGLSAAPVAWATNGYFPHGYGIKAKGMGGVSTALSQDSLGGATNPAAMVWAGNRVDLGGDVFMPKRDAQRSDAQPAGSPLNGQVDSDRTAFLIPEFGYNRMLGNELSVGISVYGNGGMNTTYPQGNFNCGQGPANMLCGSGWSRTSMRLWHWAISASRRRACRRSPAHRTSPPTRPTSPTMAPTAPPASACAWATRVV